MITPKLPAKHEKKEKANRVHSTYYLKRRALAKFYYLAPVSLLTSASPIYLVLPVIFFLAGAKSHRARWRDESRRKEQIELTVKIYLFQEQFGNEWDFLPAERNGTNVTNDPVAGTYTSAMNVWCAALVRQKQALNHSPSSSPNLH